jgi:hypothetical protein
MMHPGEPECVMARPEHPHFLGRVNLTLSFVTLAGRGLVLTHFQLNYI